MRGQSVPMIVGGLVLLLLVTGITTSFYGGQIRDATSTLFEVVDSALTGEDVCTVSGYEGKTRLDFLEELNEAEDNIVLGRTKILKAYQGIERCFGEGRETHSLGGWLEGKTIEPYNLLQTSGVAFLNTQLTMENAQEFLDNIAVYDLLIEGYANSEKYPEQKGLAEELVAGSKSLEDIRFLVRQDDPREAALATLQIKRAELSCPTPEVLGPARAVIPEPIVAATESATVDLGGMILEDVDTQSAPPSGVVEGVPESAPQEAPPQIHNLVEESEKSSEEYCNIMRLELSRLENQIETKKDGFKASGRLHEYYDELCFRASNGLYTSEALALVQGSERVQAKAAGAAGAEHCSGWL